VRTGRSTEFGMCEGWAYWFEAAFKKSVRYEKTYRQCVRDVLQNLVCVKDGRTGLRQHSSVGRACVALATCPSGEERERNQYGMRRRIANAYGMFYRIWYDL
jgi:hypothetical protein